MTRGSEANSSNSSASISTPSSDDIRSRCSAGNASSTARTSAPRAGEPGRSRPQLVTSTPVRTTSAAPRSRCASTSPSTSAIVSERLVPRPCGMTQKVQAWSQPFCTATKARVCVDAASAGGGATFHARASSFRLLGTSPSTSGIAVSCSRSISAAQPVTSSRASGRARRARRIAWRVWRTASLVTAQELITTTLRSPASSARIRSLSARFSRQPSVTTSGPCSAAITRRRPSRSCRGSSRSPGRSW